LRMLIAFFLLRTSSLSVPSCSSSASRCTPLSARKVRTVRCPDHPDTTRLNHASRGTRIARPIVRPDAYRTGPDADRPASSDPRPAGRFEPPSVYPFAHRCASVYPDARRIGPSGASGGDRTPRQLRPRCGRAGSTDDTPPATNAARHRGTRGLVTSVALSRSHRGVGGRGTALGKRQKVCANTPPLDRRARFGHVGTALGEASKQPTGSPEKRRRIRDRSGTALL
jgi:hypothetical protein